MPAFAPAILLFAWHALSRGAAFGLGWATAIFFGQIPGNKGRVVSVVGLLGSAWVILVGGVITPLLLVVAGQAIGLLERGSEESEPGLLLLVVAAAVLLPPAIVAFVEFAGFDRKRSFRRWLTRVPTSYLLAGSIGLSVLQMIVITPIVALKRMREGRRILQVPLVISDRRGIDELADDLQELLAGMGWRAQREELKGPVSWPLRTLRYAVKHLLGSVVEGDPIRLRAGDLEVSVHATDVSITAPPRKAYRVRAAIERQLAFSNVYLTWSEDSQRYEAELMRICGERERRRNGKGDLDGWVQRLDDLQEKIDTASIKSDEWNVLYRLRLQVERQWRMEATDGARGRRARADGAGAGADGRAVRRKLERTP